MLREASETNQGRMEPAVHARSLLWFRVAALIACLMAASLYYATAQLHHDPSFLLVATRQWLHGAVLYQDIMEINPPLIFYLNAPAIIASELLHASTTITFVIFVCALAAASLIWCWTLLSRAQLSSRGARSWIFLACFAALIITPQFNFGQREHLFIILALPYFLAFAFSPLGVQPLLSEKVALGVFSLLGFALKPYFLIPALFLTAVRSWQQRSLKPWRDPTNIALTSGCLLYVGLVTLLHPEYFTTLLPLGLEVYSAVAADTHGVLFESVVPLLLVAAVATVVHQRGPVRDCLVALSAAALGLVVSFVVQGKIWDYQLMPFQSMSVVLAAAAVMLKTDGPQGKPAHFLLFTLIPVLLLGNSVRYGRYYNQYADVFADRLERLEANWSESSVLVLTTNVYAGFPLINQLGAQWSGRYPYQWLIAGALSQPAASSCAENPGACEKLRSILDYARRTNVDDLINRAPSIVLIDERTVKSYLPAENFSYIDFLKADNRFNSIWSHYRRHERVLDYDIWVRVSDAESFGPSNDRLRDAAN